MKANSTTGEFAKSGNRQYLEGYNATRGIYRGAGATRSTPNAPVRFVDGEKTEDWIAANAPTLLGFDFAARGKGPGKNPGYTVFVLNTWDSPSARTHLQPEHEYHVLKINRTDPDTHDFDGIDWARIWGGRYRFMMVDLGAAPNPYEAETWGNRNRSRQRLGELRPAALGVPRRARRGRSRSSTSTRAIEQAVTPGATLGHRPAQPHDRPHGQPGRVVPLPALVPLRAAARRRASTGSPTTSGTTRRRSCRGRPT